MQWHARREIQPVGKTGGQTGGYPAGFSFYYAGFSLACPDYQGDKGIPGHGSAQISSTRLSVVVPVFPHMMIVLSSVILIIYI
jgi:hypothetical protein